MISTIIDKLTPDDIRILVESEDEFNRRGNFIRVFPNSNTQKYLKLFETKRYYNILLGEWIKKYKGYREKAINLLNNYCKKKVHLNNPCRSSENCWSNENLI